MLILYFISRISSRRSIFDAAPKFFDEKDCKESSRMIPITDMWNFCFDHWRCVCCIVIFPRFSEMIFRYFGKYWLYYCFYCRSSSSFWTDRHRWRFRSMKPSTLRHWQGCIAFQGLANWSWTIVAFVYRVILFLVFHHLGFNAGSCLKYCHFMCDGQSMILLNLRDPWMVG